MGSIQLRTEINEIPGHLEVDAHREEVVVEHETVGQVVSEREKLSEPEEVHVIPFYVEQLVLTKGLVLRGERASVASLRPSVPGHAPPRATGCRRSATHRPCARATSPERSRKQSRYGLSGGRYAKT